MKVMVSLPHWVDCSDSATSIARVASGKASSGSSAAMKACRFLSPPSSVPYSRAFAAMPLCFSASARSPGGRVRAISGSSSAARFSALLPLPPRPRRYPFRETSAAPRVPGGVRRSRRDARDRPRCEQRYRKRVPAMSDNSASADSILPTSSAISGSSSMGRNDSRATPIPPRTDCSTLSGTG